ncbi:MAG: hypothetical protein HFI41_05735 [Lachnospiraceae bacterium]|nr:hypothetical protein [Lachnospiraceae bacterium]
MDKRRAIQIMTKAAALYHVNLEDQKVLFLYGVPAEIRKQMLAGNGRLFSIKSYEVAFHRYNFLHLTGAKPGSPNVASAIHFYEKCLDNRLRQEDFCFAKDGSTAQKLDILENMMGLKRNVTMIGDFINQGPKLFTEKVTGNVCGCIGFVKDQNTRLNVPNTLLKKDIRDVIASPVQKVYAIFSKSYTAGKYSVIEKIDKGIDIHKCIFSDEVETLLERGAF